MLKVLLKVSSVEPDQKTGPENNLKDQAEIHSPSKLPVLLLPLSLCLPGKGTIMLAAMTQANVMTMYHRGS